MDQIRFFANPKNNERPIFIRNRKIILYNILSGGKYIYTEFIKAILSNSIVLFIKTVVAL